MLLIVEGCVMLLQDQAQVWRGEIDEAQAEIERLKPLQSARQWPQRAEEAHKHLEAVRLMMWPAASQGLGSSPGAMPSSSRACTSSAASGFWANWLAISTASSRSMPRATQISASSLASASGLRESSRRSFSNSCSAS